MDVYEDRGRQQWHLIKSLLPSDWDFRGKRVLDFGCGAGRIIRHALEEDAGEYWGCDIHGPSVQWMRKNLSPPLNVVQVAEWPPTSFDSQQFDLVFAFSVFTHLLDSWSTWLLELHRVLADSGILIVTVFGPGATAYGDVAIDEDRYGMNALQPGTSNPLIVHSEWWLRAHWGRAFEITELRQGDPSGAPPLFGQGMLVMHKRPGPLMRDDLERPAPQEPRELVAAHENLATLRREVEYLTSYMDIVMTSRSWQITSPMRAAGRVVRRRLGRDPGLPPARLRPRRHWAARRPL